MVENKWLIFGMKPHKKGVYFEESTETKKKKKQYLEFDILGTDKKVYFSTNMEVPT